MIVVLGSINLDLIFPLPSLPAPGETILTRSARIEPGGKGANQAVAAARDGARVIMAGAVGRDALAAGALRILRDTGIDISRVIETDDTTGCAGIFVDDHGRNVIGVGSGANLAVVHTQVEDDLLRADSTLLLQMEIPATATGALIDRARQRGARIALNLAPAAPLNPAALRAVDILVVNEAESAWLAAQLGYWVERRRIAPCAGRDGRAYTWANRAPRRHRRRVSIEVPARPVVAVDTTGAGDCFSGVLAAALDRSMPLEASLRRAAIAASICCTRRGSQATMPTTAEIDAAI